MMLPKPLLVGKEEGGENQGAAVVTAYGKS